MKKFVTLIFIISIAFQLTAGNIETDKAYRYLQSRGEVYFKIYPENLKKDVALLSKIISVDKIKDDVIFAYANKQGFEKFLKQKNLKFEILTPPSMIRKPVMRDQVNIKNVNDWDFYPTYDAYEDMMEQFAADYPNLCELQVMTTLPSGRKLLVLHINNDLTTEQNEPEFLYTSTMHGDEVTGYVLMLRYIDYLLSNYGTNQRITDLVNNIDIWINPLANPDGTYAGGNNNIWGATRYNANYVDLNRNYPDPDEGPHPDGESYQPETQAFMQLAEEHNFVMSANFHGGAEVVNYPWDTWARLTADDNWWKYVSHQYADTVHNFSNGYMTDFDNGITNGYAWYTISGGRQDYMNYYRHCREVTIELSDAKTPPASELPAYWNYNFRSFLNYMEQSNFGLRGIITGNDNNAPIKAMVHIDGHDMDSSEVYSSLPVGDYHRMLKAGNYNVTYLAYGYHPQTVPVTIVDGQATVENVELQAIVGVMADFHASITATTPNSPINFYDDSFGNITSWTWYFPGAEPSTASVKNPQNIKYSETGNYDVTLIVADNQGHIDTLTKENYITISNVYLMSNSTVDICNGLFYDSGGESANYSDSEDYTMTFKPAETGGKIKAEFIEFNVEDNAYCDYDYLEIYDGVDNTASLIGKYCGTTSPGTIEATNLDGALTFVFHSDFSINRPGWKAVLSCTGTGVGITENSSKPVTVFPNPAKEKITVKADTKISEILIYNLNGQLLVHNYSDKKLVSLDVSSLSKGVYLITLKTEKENVNKKLVIQ